MSAFPANAWVTITYAHGLLFVWDINVTFALLYVPYKSELIITLTSKQTSTKAIYLSLVSGDFTHNEFKLYRVLLDAYH